MSYTHAQIAIDCNAMPSLSFKTIAHVCMTTLVFLITCLAV